MGLKVTPASQEIRMVISEGPQGWWEMRGVSHQVGAGQSFGKETASHNIPLPSGCPSHRPFPFSLFFSGVFFFHFQWVPAGGPLGRWEFQVFLHWRRGREPGGAAGYGLCCVFGEHGPWSHFIFFPNPQAVGPRVRPGISSWNQFQGSGCGRPW